MTTIRKLISAWMLALVGTLLLPLMSFAAVSGTTYDVPSTTTTHPVTIAECTVAIEAVDCGRTSLRSMVNGQSWSLLGLSGGFLAPKTELSPFRYTTKGETFQHYSYGKHAKSLSGGLRPGGYGTTAKGLSGAQAKSGLSLRHATPPDAVYTVKPPPGTPVRVNPVTRPQFGQPGGLSEVEFILGTPPGSVSGSTPIP